MSVRQMGEVWDLDLPTTRKFVLIALADHADHDGAKIYPSVARIAHKTGLSRRQVQYELKALRDEDELIELVREGGGRGNPSEYRLTLENGAHLAPFKPKTDSRKGAHSAPKKAERVQTTTQKGAECAPEPSIEPSVIPNGGANAPQDEKKPIEKNPVKYLVDLLKETKERGLHPPPLPPRQRSEYGQFVTQALKDGEPSELCDTALHWLVAKASGEINDEKKAWAFFGTALDHAREGWRPQGHTRAAPTDERHLRLVRENEAMLADLLKDTAYG